MILTRKTFTKGLIVYIRAITHTVLFVEIFWPILHICFGSNINLDQISSSLVSYEDFDPKKKFPVKMKVGGWSYSYVDSVREV